MLDGLARSAQKIGISSSDKVDIGISLESVIKDIDEKLPDVIDHINFAKAKIQNEFTQLGGTEILEEEFQKKAQAEKGIRVTIGLNADSKNVLYKQTIDVINSVQKNLNKPILVEVQLVSAYQSRGNQTLLSQIQEELNNIQDGEVTEKLQGLIDKMNKRVENAFIMNVYLNTQNATNQLRHFIKEMKEEISDLQKLLTINPEFEITPEIRQKLIDEIEEVKTLYQATIDVKFNFDDKDYEEQYSDDQEQFLYNIRYRNKYRLVIGRITFRLIRGIIRNYISELERSGILGSIVKSRSAHPVISDIVIQFGDRTFNPGVKIDHYRRFIKVHTLGDHDISGFVKGKYLF